MEDKKTNGLEYLRSLKISDISAKTFIHEAELQKILNLDFEGMNKTKVIGFIQILEREFHIDLDDLRQKYKEYLSEHKVEQQTQAPTLIIEEVKSEKRKKGLFTVLFLAGAIGSVAYIIDKYDLLNFSNMPKIFSSTSEQNISEPLVETQKKDSEAKEQKEEVLINPMLVEKEENKQKEEIKKVEEIPQTNTTLLESKQKEEEISLNNILTPIDEEQTTNNQQTATEENDQIAQVDLSKLNAELATEEEVTQKKEEDQNTNTQEVIQNELYIIPQRKVWIGTIDLDTLKKKDFLAPRGKRVDIDTNTNKLIMIGHKFIKIYLNEEEVEFKGKGPIRFKYIDGKLEQIGRKEFNSLAKGRQW